MFGGIGKLFGLGGGAAAGASGAATGAATAGAATASGGALSGILGAVGGPIGIAAMIGLPLVSKLFGGLFGGDPLKPYKRLIKAEYGIDASKQMLQKVFEIGQSKFGKDAPKRQIETVRLPEVRDMLSEYSGAFMKGGNAKLFDSKVFGDQFSAVNQFKVKMLNGGRVPGQQRGYDHIPALLDGGEMVVSNKDQRRGGGGGGWTAKAQREVADMLAKVADSLDRFHAMPADHVVMTGLEKRPGLATRDVLNSYKTRDTHSQEIRNLNATR